MNINIYKRIIQFSLIYIYYLFLLLKTFYS